MATYNRIFDDPKKFEKKMGLDLKIFNYLYELVEIEYERQTKLKKARKKKNVANAGGRKYNLALKNRLQMLLLRYETNLTYNKLASQFGLNQSNAYRNIKGLEPVLKKCVNNTLQKNPNRRIKTVKKYLVKNLPATSNVIKDT